MKQQTCRDVATKNYLLICNCVWNIEPCLEVKRKITANRIVRKTCSNDSLLEPLDKFRSETFFVIVDTLWSKFKSDFKESKAIVKEMSN